MSATTRAERRSAQSPADSPPHPDRPPSARRRPALLALLFLAITLAAGGYGAGIQPALKAGGLIALDSESKLARDWLHEGLGVSQPDIVAVFSSDELKATDSDFYDEIEPVLDALTEHPDVESVTSYFDSGQIAMVSRDESRAVVFVSLRGDDTTKNANLARLTPLFHTSSLAVEIGGPLPAEVYAQETAFRDLEHAELLALPIVLVLLFLFFRGITATLLPVAVAVFAIPCSLGLLRLLTWTMDVSVFALNVASIIGIGLAIDYSLLIVTRFREELAEGRAIDAALERTMRTAGHAILISGVTVAASLAALLLFPLMILRTIGIAGVLVVFCALVGALVLLPALMSLFGAKLMPRESQVSNRFGPHMHTFAQAVMRRPVSLAVGTTVLLLALGSPVLRMKSAMPDVSVFPRESEVRRVDERLESPADFGGRPLTPILVAVRGEAPFDQPGEIEKLIDYVDALKAVAGIDRVTSPFALGKLAEPENARAGLQDPESLSSDDRKFLDQTLRGDLALVYVYGTHPWRSNAAADLVASIRELPAPGLTVQVGGPTAENYDGRSALLAWLPSAAAVIVAANMVILFLAFGSVVIPLKAIAMNIVSISASFGALVWIFQDGHLAGLLHFDPPGGIDMTVPVVLLAVVFGLSMDYEIFLLSRIKEEFDRSDDNTNSVAVGLEHTTSIITRAAVLLIAVVAAFAFGELIFVKEVGVGMVIAILIDATIVRCILVPSTMKLLGRWNWWAPAWLRRLWNPRVRAH